LTLISGVGQTVSYTAKVVSKLSEVASSMNVSHSSSIKKGTVEIGGDSNVLDENKFLESDVNILVSVKVSLLYKNLTREPAAY
jgi:hypothetical protein